MHNKSGPWGPEAAQAALNPRLGSEGGETLDPCTANDLILTFVAGGSCSGKETLAVADTGKKISHLLWPCASLRVVTQPGFGKSRPPVVGVEHLCPCACETELSTLLITQFPRGGSMNGWKKLGAPDYSGLNSVPLSLNPPKTSERDFPWK